MGIFGHIDWRLWCVKDYLVQFPVDMCMYLRLKQISTFSKPLQHRNARKIYEKGILSKKMSNFWMVRIIRCSPCQWGNSWLFLITVSNFPTDGDILDRSEKRSTISLQREIYFHQSETTVNSSRTSGDILYDLENRLEKYPTIPPLRRFWILLFQIGR